MTGIVAYTKGDDLLRQVNSLELHIAARDRKLIIAAGKRPVSEYGQDELMVEVDAMLTAVFRIVGIHRAPDAFDKAIFFQNLVERFPTLTLTDVRNAFEMQALGELEGYVPAKHEHFQQFSLAYFGKVLKGYQQLQREAMHEANGKVQLKLMDLNRSESEKSGVGKLKLVRHLRDLCHKYLMTGKDEFLIHDSVLNILKGIKLIEHIPEPTTEQLKEAATKSSKRVDFAVASGYRKAIENGEAPEDVVRIATVKAARVEILRAIEKAGIDRIDEMFDWAEQRVKEHFNITEEDAA